MEVPMIPAPFAALRRSAALCRGVTTAYDGLSQNRCIWISEDTEVSSCITFGMKTIRRSHNTLASALISPDGCSSPATLVTTACSYPPRLVFHSCRKRAKPSEILADIRAIGAAGLALNPAAPLLPYRYLAFATGCADDHDQRADGRGRRGYRDVAK